MFEENTLIIPDRVLKADLPFIIHFFEHYKIATLQDAQYFDHVKDEYDNDNNTVFGYVIVKVKRWYDNNGAVSFYESLLNNKAKLVYNDPVYWDVKLYKNTENSNLVIESSEGSHETMNGVSLNTTSSPNLQIVIVMLIVIANMKMNKNGTMKNLMNIQKQVKKRMKKMM